MKKAVTEQLSSLVTAAFGLVAALAWNGAIQEVFKTYYGETSGIQGMLVYAVLVTIIAVFVSVQVGKMNK